MAEKNPLDYRYARRSVTAAQIDRITSDIQMLRVELKNLHKVNRALHGKIAESIMEQNEEE